MVPIVGDHMVYDYARYQAGDGPDGGPKASSRMAWPAAAPATVATPMVAASLKLVRLEVGGSETGDRETEQPELRQSPAARSVRMMDLMVIRIMRPQLGERWRESERRRRREDSFREDPPGRIASDFFPRMIVSIATVSALSEVIIAYVRGVTQFRHRWETVPAGMSCTTTKSANFPGRVSRSRIKATVSSEKPEFWAASHVSSRSSCRRKNLSGA
jgi:hypothetical protein